MNGKEAVIKDVLKELELEPKYKGYSYLVYGLLLLLEEELLLTCLRKGLYGQIAVRFDTAISNVDRNISTAKAIIWDKKQNHPIFRRNNYCPVNGEFWDLLLCEVERRINLDNDSKK